MASKGKVCSVGNLKDDLIISQCLDEVLKESGKIYTEIEDCDEGEEDQIIWIRYRLWEKLKSAFPG